MTSGEMAGAMGRSELRDGKAGAQPSPDSLLRTLHAITLARRVDDVCAAVQRFVVEQGYISFAIGRDIDGPTWNGGPEIHTWPRAIVTKYIKHRRVEVDRGIAALRGGAQTYTWQRPTAFRTKMDETMALLLEEAQIEGGLLVDIRGGVSKRSVFSLMAKEAQLPSEHFIDACRMIGDAALLRLTVPSQPRPRFAQPLTDRQIDILTWAARGKSNRDIAAILELTERNVVYHLSKAMAAIGVQSRSQAAAWLAQNAPEALHPPS